MDLNPLGSLPHFDTFDDDVSKESGDLTVDAGLSNEGPFLSSVSVSGQDIPQGLSVVQTPSEVQPVATTAPKAKQRRPNKRKAIDQDNKKGKGEIAAVRKADPTEEESGTFDIPIFTEEFLEHNKARDAELRQLRKQTAELEEQNAILGKHTDNMRQAIDRLEVESTQTKQTNAALATHLEALRSCLTTAFSSVPLPGTEEFPTVETIDSYMSQLHSLIVSAPIQHADLINTLRDIVGRLSMQLDTAPKVR